MQVGVQAVDPVEEDVDDATTIASLINMPTTINYLTVKFYCYIISR